MWWLFGLEDQPRLNWRKSKSIEIANEFYKVTIYRYRNIEFRNPITD